MYESSWLSASAQHRTSAAYIMLVPNRPTIGNPFPGETSNRDKSLPPSPLSRFAAVAGPAPHHAPSRFLEHIHAILRGVEVLALGGVAPLGLVFLEHTNRSRSLSSIFWMMLPEPTQHSVRMPSEGPRKGSCLEEVQLGRSLRRPVSRWRPSWLFVQRGSPFGKFLVQ